MLIVFTVILITICVSLTVLIVIKGNTYDTNVFTNGRCDVFYIEYGYIIGALFGILSIIMALAFRSLYKELNDFPDHVLANERYTLKSLFFFFMISFMS
jgi:hypothetical protein